MLKTFFAIALVSFAAASLVPASASAQTSACGVYCEQIPGGGGTNNGNSGSGNGGSAGGQSGTNNTAGNQSGNAKMSLTATRAPTREFRVPLPWQQGLPPTPVQRQERMTAPPAAARAVIHRRRPPGSRLRTVRIRPTMKPTRIRLQLRPAAPAVPAVRESVPDFRSCWR